MLGKIDFALVAIVGLTFAVPSTGAVVIGPEADIIITENFDDSTGLGSYNVENNTADYWLTGFGVSNPLSNASVGSYSETFSCTGPPLICYRAISLNESNWGFEIAFEGQTFAEIFGDFYLNVEPGEFSINWYGAVDGELAPPPSADPFPFQAISPASLALGILNSESDTVFFQHMPVAQVPLPAAAWLFGSALLGLGAVKRRKA